MNYCGATGRVSKDRYAHNPDSVTPECLYRGSRAGFAWIPAKSMRE